LAHLQTFKHNTLIYTLYPETVINGNLYVHTNFWSNLCRIYWTA